MFIEMDCPCKGKYLDKMLQPGILSALKDEKMHGFSLIQKLADNPMFGGTQPDKAGVYRYLKKWRRQVSCSLNGSLRMTAAIRAASMP